MKQTHWSVRLKAAAAVLIFSVLMLATLVSADEDNKKYTIKTVPGDYAIQANVKLSGSGTGFHAKLLVCTATAATSFGIQYDQHAPAPYTGKACFMYENVMSNAPGGQRYDRLGQTALKVKSKLMLAFTKRTGEVSFYVNGYKIGSVVNPNLRNRQVYLRVEGCARKRGDKVKAVFTNIKLKRQGIYNKKYPWSLRVFDTNKKIRSNISKFVSSRKIVVSGKIAGISSAADWDSAYNSVSGVVQFME
jgi:hypothetical protein